MNTRFMKNTWRSFQSLSKDLIYRKTLKKGRNAADNDPLRDFVHIAIIENIGDNLKSREGRNFENFIDVT